MITDSNVRYQAFTALLAERQEYFIAIWFMGTRSHKTIISTAADNNCPIVRPFADNGRSVAGIYQVSEENRIPYPKIFVNLRNENVTRECFVQNRIDE